MGTASREFIASKIKSGHRLQTLWTSYPLSLSLAVVASLHSEPGLRHQDRVLLRYEEDAGEEAAHEIFQSIGLLRCKDLPKYSTSQGCLKLPAIPVTWRCCEPREA